jgi:predicted lipopolysaccharide heptosyltransferase III
LDILIVRLRLIGDVVFTTPVVGALRRRFPDARLVYLVEAPAAPVVAGNPHLSEVIVAPRRRGWRRVVDDLRLARRLRARRFDVALDLHGGPRAAWLTWASRARVRVGYDVPGRTWMYTAIAPRSRVLQPRHSVENQWDVLSAFDAAFASGPDRTADRVAMAVDADAAARARARWRAAGLPADAEVVVLHVSAGNPFRRWPETSFAELAASLATASRRRWVVLTSGPSDHDAAERVAAAARASAGAAGARIVNDRALSLAELRGVLDDAALFIGGDSGPLHIAATTDVPIVGLYGPTLPARSAPWRPAGIPTVSIDAGALPCRPCDQRVCVTHDYRCLAHIPADAVRDAAERLLEGGR